jgi:hypothetical protein
MSLRAMFSVFSEKPPQHRATASKDSDFMTHLLYFSHGSEFLFGSHEIDCV